MKHKPKNILSCIPLLLSLFITSCSAANVAYHHPHNLFQRNRPNPKVYALAKLAYKNALRKGITDPKHLLTVVDYSLPSNLQRLWVMDVTNNKVIYQAYVAHGMHTGITNAKHFSDQAGSLESSIGLYQTGHTYIGKHGYSLKINGLEPGYNDQALSRHIVVHGAPYVTQAFIDRYGRLGRSWGCLTLNPKVAPKIINTIKDHTLIFAYYPNRKWLTTSRFL